MTWGKIKSFTNKLELKIFGVKKWTWAFPVSGNEIWDFLEHVAFIQTWKQAYLYSVSRELLLKTKRIQNESKKTDLR